MTHNFERVLKEFLALHPDLLEGDGPLELEVKHDPWCGLLQNKPCDCNPIIRLPNQDSDLDTSHMN